MSLIDPDVRGVYLDDVLRQIDGRVVWWTPDGSVRHCVNARLEAVVARLRANDDCPVPPLVLPRCRTVRPPRRPLQRVA